MLPLGNLVWFALSFCPSLYSASSCSRARVSAPSGCLPPCDWLMVATSLGKGQTGALRESSTITNLTVIALKVGAMHMTPNVGI